MSKINFTLEGTIEETQDYIMAVGSEQTVVVVSEPGVGKSSMLKHFEEKYGDEYDYIYVDCPVKNMMDIGANIPNHAARSLEYYVAGLFKLTGDTAKRKKIIMLDEFMKAPKLMSILYTRLMLEHMVGDEPLPAGSIVFGTANNVSDNVGDALLDHAGNRVCIFQMRKPDSERWLAWAMRQKTPVNRAVRAWAAMNSKAFHSYRDGEEATKDNPYIFNPRNPGRQFVSPRSLVKAGITVDKFNEKKITENAMMVGMAGVVGEAAAKSMAAFIMLESKLVSYKQVQADPKGIKVPDDISALVMMMFEAVDNVDTQDSLSSYMEFVERIPHTEVQSIFFTMILRGKPRLARYNARITQWAKDNHKVM